MPQLFCLVEDIKQCFWFEKEIKLHIKTSFECENPTGYQYLLRLKDHGKNHSVKSQIGNLFLLLRRNNNQKYKNKNYHYFVNTYT